MSTFKFVVVSAGFEHGGNVTHRHLDGHPDLMVYPFESQLGNRYYNDFLASIERVQYRYPEMPEGLSHWDLYEQFMDEEMKTFLRRPNGSKFKGIDLILDEKKRFELFSKYIGRKTYSRKFAVEAFFKATFDAWENYYTRPNANKFYVAYSPVIGIDAPRIIFDFPTVKIIHIVRNPFSAFRDTKRRPYPLPIDRYAITWNIYHSTVQAYESLYPQNVKIMRYEDLVENKSLFMNKIANFIGVAFNESMTYPSWNGVDISNQIAPWGTVLKSTEDYNKQILEDLSSEEINRILCITKPLALHFGYNKIEYLRDYYA